MKKEISFTELYELASNDLAFYTDLLETLIHSCQNGIEDIEKALKSENYLAIAELAHKLASPLKHIHAIDLHESLKFIESACRSNQINQDLNDKIRAVLEDISHILPIIQTEINLHI